jgi:hypothetical protein
VGHCDCGSSKPLPLRSAPARDVNAGDRLDRDDGLFSVGRALLCLIGFLCQLSCPDPKLLYHLRVDCGFRERVASAFLFAQRVRIMHPISEANRKSRERAEETRRRNTIEFGGTPYDATSDEFATSFAGIADALFAQSDWRARSRLRQSVLREMLEGDGGGRPGGGRGRPSRPAPRPPEAVRGAMGLAG